MLCLTAPAGRATVHAAGAAATALAATPTYSRHAPERTLLYALVLAHYPDFIACLEVEDRSLPAYVREEFRRIPALRRARARVPAGCLRAVPCRAAARSFASS